MTTFRFLGFTSFLLAFQGVSVGILLSSCSSNDGQDQPVDTDPTAAQASDAAVRDAQAPGDLDASLDAAAADAGSDLLVEKPLSLELSLALTTSDAGVGDAGSDAGDAGASTQTAKLTIVALDQTTPVITDLWLYTLDASNVPVPLSGFSATANRKSPRLLMPATIAGQPSGLVPADDGHSNGVMTGTSRGTRKNGVFVPNITGTVVVTLPSLPGAPILVIAAREDQRYAGAAVINQDGSPGVVPAGVGVPETHVRRSFTRDVVPILHDQCVACHVPNGPETANFYRVTGTRDDLVNDNFVIAEDTAKCSKAVSDGGVTDAGVTFDQCVLAIDEAQFLVEPGAPAISGLISRSRPDEDAGTSALGLAWYGSRGNRYNASYGDRRMPSTTISLDMADWQNAATPFDSQPAQFQILFDWVAQGAQR